MLREVDISLAVVKDRYGETALVLYQDRVMTLKEALAGMRFLIDEPDPDPEEEEEEKKADKAEQKEEKAKQKEEKPKQRTASMEQEILKAWNGGDRSIKDIMAITGASYSTVRKYIPANKNG